MPLRRWIMPILVFLTATAAIAGDADSNGSDAAQHLLLTGQAFDHMGGGVNKAQVTVTLKSTGATIGETQTDDYGDFKITSATPYTGAAVVTIKKPHHKDVVSEVELGGPSGPPFVDASMVGNIILSGTVTDRREGKPVPDAKLRVESGYNEFNATTDAEGAFRIENLSPGPLGITVEAERFARKRVKIKAVEDAGPQAIVLDPERIAHLIVTDDKAKPIAGVGVECLDEPVRDYRQELTDETGRVVLRGLRFDAKQLRVRLSHDHYVSDADFARTIELPADANVSTHGLVMHDAGVVIGTITDATTDKPLYGARISAGRVLDDYQPRAWSEFDGTYRIVGVTPGRMVITVHLAGHAPQLREVQVTAAEEVSADFALTEARTITGKLVDPDDKPVADAYIRATRWSGHDTLGLQTMADDTGAFQIIDAPNDAFEIAIYAPGFKPLLDQAITADNDAYTYQLALDPRKGPGIGGSGPAEGSDAPDFTVTTLDGTKITLSELRGKVVLIDFWATWCGPCVGEIPNLVATREAHGSRDDFVMLSISIEGDTARVKEFTEARKMNWLQAVGDESGAEDAAERYEVNAIPALFLINRDGKIAARDLRGPTIRTQVGELLSQETVTNEKQ